MIQELISLSLKNFELTLFIIGMICSLGLIHRYYKMAHHPVSKIKNVTNAVPGYFDLEKKRQEDLGIYPHMKNPKKYTHLYDLEKHFK